MAQFPRVDYALAGDPEPILRNLLDYIDIEQRLRRVPGLIYKDQGSNEPYWLSDLRSLSLPDWEGVFWQSYQSGITRDTARAEMRISRGHTGVPADRACGKTHEPLRCWPMDRMAPVLAKCGHLGITDVFISDPPGVWTPERLKEWCSILEHTRNSQPWSLQLLPTFLDEETVNSMMLTECKRVEFVYPSCDLDILRSYGCVITPKEMIKTFALLKDYDIDVLIRFWVGGPEMQSDDSKRIVNTIRALNYCRYVLEPFPLQFDSPLYQHYKEEQTIPLLEDWIQWSLDPWLMEKPIPLWGGAGEADYIQSTFNDIYANIKHSPARLMRKLSNKLNSVNWIRAMENKSLGWLISRSENRTQ